VGLRFRRTLKIMPGVRLNFSLSGVSASVGPRGASVSLSGRRPPAINLGIPGTGLSVREQLGGTSQRSSGSSGAQQTRWERAQAREAERAAAVEALDAHQARLEALQSILGRRDPHPIDWASEFSDPAEFLPSRYVPPANAPTLADVRAAQAAAHPAARWGLAALGATVGAWLAPPGWVQVTLGLAGVGIVADAVRIRRRLAGLAPATLATWEADYTQAEVTARDAFEASQAEVRAEREAMADLHAQFRSIVVDANVALAASFLEVELPNEDLGVSIEFDVEFEDIHRVRLIVTLPDIDELPATKAALTQTGKLSQRKVSQRDRGALYESVCAGVVLRLAYETFRVLPFVTQVQAVGMATRPGLGTLVSRYPALALETTPEALGAMDLDGGEPAAILRHLGGQVAVARDGTLKAVEAAYADD